MLSDASSERPSTACRTNSFSRTGEPSSIAVRTTKIAGRFPSSSWSHEPFTSTEGHFVPKTRHLPHTPASRTHHNSHDAAKHDKLNTRLPQPLPAGKYSE